MAKQLPSNIIVIVENGPTAGRVEPFGHHSQLNNQRSRRRAVKQEPIDLDPENTPQHQMKREQLLGKGIKTEPIDLDDTQIITRFGQLKPSSVIVTVRIHKW
jgi:hypothetical protein